ncbi:MAG TPA: O-antigen ligase family protein [Chloroflexota bacterium]|nr:O-antigen ligase family protein [Chloroflexota bacterium]HUM68382.1 O-antigen ligase family protein [Chloroflexota bacterium]
MNKPLSADRLIASPLLFAIGAAILGLATGMAVLFSDNILLPVALVAALLLVWLVFNHPNAVLALLVFATYTRFSDVLEKYYGVPSFILPLALLLLGSLFMRWWFLGERIHNWERTAVLLGIYGLVIFTSLFYAADYGRSQNAIIEFIKNCLLLFAVVLAMRDSQSLRGVSYALLAAGIFMGSLTVYQQLTGTFENAYWGFAQTEVKNIVTGVSDYRAAGPVGSTNYYALVMVVLVPLALDRVWHERKLAYRFLGLWALVVSILAVIFTFSRGGFIALVVVLAIMIVRESLDPLKLLLSLTLLFIAWQFIPANYTERLSTTLDLLPGRGENARNEISFRGRTSEVVVAWLIFADHPVMGVGLNNYKNYYQAYAQPLGWDNRREERAAHSLYLEMAAETGLVGLAAFGAIVVVALRRAYQTQKMFMRAGRYDEATLAFAWMVALVGYLVASLFLHGAYLRYFWLLIGILLALPQTAMQPLKSLETTIWPRRFLENEQGKLPC